MIRTLVAAGVCFLLTAGAAAARPGVDATFGPTGITLTEDGKPLLFYVTKSADPGTEPGRENYIHPIYAPDGVVITRDDPRADHRGLFWAWSRVMVDGKVVADGRMGRSLTISMREAHYEGHMDGSGVLTVRSDWLVNSAPELTYVAEEVTQVHVYPGWLGSRRIELDTVITPRVAGFALAADEQRPGDSGLSLNLFNEQQLVMMSDGKWVKAGPDPFEAGPTMNIGWSAGPTTAAWNVGLACEVAGVRTTRWLIDHTGVTCVFPTAEPVVVPKTAPLHLKATIVIRPATRPH